MSDVTRIAKWDNLKFYLIALVVIGHATHHFLDFSEAAKGIYLFIYSFHMPAFVFVAGMFSKGAVRGRRYGMVVQFLLIYLIMKFLDAAGDAMTGHRIDFHFLWESGPAWFALAMAVFLAATKLLSRFRAPYIIGIALFIGCLAGLDTHFGDHFASMRICVFYPVFLAGYYMDTQRVTALQSGARGIALKVSGLAALAAVFALCMIKTESLYPLLKLFKGKYEYADMDMGFEGILMRLICYAFWALMIAAVVFAATGKRLIYTWLGSRTMAVFIWHSIALTIVFDVLHMTTWLSLNAPTFYMVEVVCIGLLVTILTAYLPEFRIENRLTERKE